MGQWVGLAAKFSVELSLSTLGPVGGFGSEIVGGIVAKYFKASGGWQRNFRCKFRWVLWGQWVGLAAVFWVEFSLSTLGPVGEGDSEIFVGNFAKYMGATGGRLAVTFSVEFSLSTLGPVGWVWQQKIR